MTEPDEYPIDPDEPTFGEEDPDTVPPANAVRIRQSLLQQRQQGGVTAAPKKVSRSGSPSKILAKENQRKALELRKGGAQYADIARALGYKDHSGARRAVQAAIKEITQEPAIEVRTLQIERLNHMMVTLWGKVQMGDERAIETTLRIMAQIDRLMGTEAATQVDVNVAHKGAVLVIDGSKEDFIRSMRQMAGVGSDGHNALPAGNVPPTGLPSQDDEIIDAVLVDTPDHEPYGTTWDVSGTDAVHTGGEVPPPKKKYAFGVDPKKE